jgi:hypothetical protein
LVLDQLKREVASGNTTFRLSGFEVLLNAALANITRTVWQSCIKRPKNLQDEDFRNERLRDIIMEPLIDNLQFSSSSADNSDTGDRK